MTPSTISLCCPVRIRWVLIWLRLLSRLITGASLIASGRVPKITPTEIGLDIFPLDQFTKQLDILTCCGVYCFGMVNGSTQTAGTARLTLAPRSLSVK